MRVLLSSAFRRKGHPMFAALQAPCPVCGQQATRANSGNGDTFEIVCRRCGNYLISGSCVAVLGNPGQDNGLLNSDLKKASVGHWLRLCQKENEKPLLRSEVAEGLAIEPWLPALRNQREYLLCLLGDRADGPGERVLFDSEKDQYIIGARSPSVAKALVDRLVQEGLANCDTKSQTQFAMALTFSGWLEFEDISRGITTGRNAFMAMPFNKPDLEDTWLPRLRGTVLDTGFTLKRVDDEPKPGIIDVRMRLQIKEARFLIVELTHANNGAYWEAGFAEGLGKPVIYTCQENHPTHFDVDHSLRIEWNPDNLEPALARLKATIRNALPDALPESDVAHSIPG